MVDEGDASVLVVDDTRTNRLKMSLAVTSLGHTVVTAENGLDAIEKLKEQTFDLILLDIEMPGLDGYGVLTYLNSQAELRDLPVIVISAADEMDNIVRAIELGAQDFLPKDFEKVLFKARLNACLEKKRFSDQRTQHLAQIEHEKQRVDDLLLATLPVAAIEELKATNQVKPRRHENVVVLIADIVDFTRFCDAHKPEDAVSRLQKMVTGFEEITRKHGLEKIKTVGDAYIATAGLLNTIDDPATAATNCAMEMSSITPELTNGWEVRVGIHMGPVIAGVIGHHQHLFDLWGDTVNTAARISDLAKLSSVCVSQSVVNKLHDVQYDVEMVEVKGKGIIEVYHLLAS